MKMRAIKSLLVMTAVAGLVATMGARSFAGPLMPPLNVDQIAAIPGLQVAGESTIYGLVGVPPSTVPIAYVDWLVLGPADYTSTVFAPLVTDIFGSPVALAYIYAYQIEPLIEDISIFTVHFAPASITGAGFSNLDLDLVGHDASIFSNLGPTPSPAENEIAGAPLVTPTGVEIDPGNNVSWKFATRDLDPGRESYVLWILSDLPPVYGIATAQDRLPSPGAGTVPVPSPEPGTFVLLMMGIMGLGGVARLRRKV